MVMHVILEDTSIVGKSSSALVAHDESTVREIRIPLALSYNIIDVLKIDVRIHRPVR